MANKTRCQKLQGGLPKSGKNENIIDKYDYLVYYLIHEYQWGEVIDRCGGRAIMLWFALVFLIGFACGVVFTMCAVAAVS